MKTQMTGLPSQFLIQLVVGRPREAAFLTGGEAVWLKDHRLGNGRGNDFQKAVHPKFYLQVWGL